MIGVTWHQADLLSSFDRERLLAEAAPTDIVHAAWDLPPSTHYYADSNKEWLSAGINLFRRASMAGATRILGLGTCWEYDVSGGWCREHETPLRPCLPYSEAKAALGNYLLGLKVKGLSTIWGRVFFAFGPGEIAPQLVTGAIRTLLAGQPFPCSHGRQVRDFIYVEDLADAISALLESSMSGSVNFASGAPRSLRSIMEAVAKEVGREDLVRFGAITPTGHDAEPMLVGDVSRLTEELGWSPPVGFEEGIRRTVAWWRERMRATVKPSAS